MTKQSEKQIDTELMLSVPSQLIRFGLKALEQYENTPGFQAEMMTFREYRPEQETCFFCLGGAAMMKLKGVETLDDTKDSDTWGWPGKAEAALSVSRHGRAKALFKIMKIQAPKEAIDSLNRKIVPYKHDPALFKQQMHQFADDLAAKGY